MSGHSKWASDQASEGARTRPGASCSPSSSARSRWPRPSGGGGRTSTPTLRSMMVAQGRRFGAHRHHRARAVKRGTGELRGRHLRVDHLRGHDRPAGSPVLVDVLTDNRNCDRCRDPQPVLGNGAGLDGRARLRCRGSSRARRSVGTAHHQRGRRDAHCPLPGPGPTTSSTRATRGESHGRARSAVEEMRWRPGSRRITVTSAGRSTMISSTSVPLRTADGCQEGATHPRHPLRTTTTSRTCTRATFPTR